MSAATKLRTGTLHDFFTSSRIRGPPQGRTFFDLPYNVRRQIYSYLHLDGRTIWLNYLVPTDKKWSIGIQSYGDGLGSDSTKVLSEYTRSVSQFVSGPCSDPPVFLNLRCECLGLEIWADLCYCEIDYCDCEPFPSELLHVSPRLVNLPVGPFVLSLSLPFSHFPKTLGSR